MYHPMEACGFYRCRWCAFREDEPEGISETPECFCDFTEEEAWHPDES